MKSYCQKTQNCQDTISHYVKYIFVIVLQDIKQSLLPDIKYVSVWCFEANQGHSKMQLRMAAVGKESEIKVKKGENI